MRGQLNFPYLAADGHIILTVAKCSAVLASAAIYWNVEMTRVSFPASCDPREIFDQAMTMTGYSSGNAFRAPGKGGLVSAAIDPTCDKQFTVR
jgi:hypothetical protein